jgi:hypothetical protein
MTLVERLRRYASLAHDLALGEALPSSDDGGVLKPWGVQTSVERYALSLTQEIILGTPCRVYLANSPDMMFRPESIVANIPWPGFLIVDDIRSSNVSILIGGSMDAFNLKSKMIDGPRVRPGDKMCVIAHYTGLIPNELRAHVATNGDVLAFRQEISRLRRALTDCQQARWTCGIKKIARAALAVDWEPRVEVRTPPTFNVCVTASGPASMIT